MSSDIQLNRRRFLRQASAAAGSVVTLNTIGALTAHAAWWDETGQAVGNALMPLAAAGYGPLERVADQNGQFVIALPSGFQYVTFSRTGTLMTDGTATPAIHDGMACFTNANGTLRLIRNHELRNSAGSFTLGVRGPASTRYDSRGAGGCVTLDFDPNTKRVVRDFVSLNGTYANCSGGLAYNDSGWLSCEEDLVGPYQGFQKRHGYTFLVRRNANAAEIAVPIPGLGRFRKEAAVADQLGVVYQTEDEGDTSGFYRFMPNDPTSLLSGGALQMLGIRGRANYDTRTRQTIGAELPVEWKTIDQPDPTSISRSRSVFGQGFGKGGARFNRLEGIFRGDDGSIYFVSTSGGNARCGQLWQYISSSIGGTLVLRFESPSGSVLEGPDNLCMTQRGGILLCENDTSAGPVGDRHPLAPGLSEINRLIGLSSSGEPFEFAVNTFSNREFAGACFSPDGQFLFVNIQGTRTSNSGMTCAIWGPWGNGPLS